ncbi:MAG TPA: hypothetical protein VNC40_02685 [Gaiellaceae bacterium]|nr:hypothetical protein [Gaiellaceae bacterium]
MTILTEVGLAAASVWMVVLTVAIMLCIRQLGGLTVRLELVARGGGGYAHGASVGFRISDALIRLYPDLGRGRRILVLVSSTCTTCARLIEEFRQFGPPPAITAPEELIALVAGHEEQQANQIVETLEGMAAIIREPLATELARGLRLANVPSALLIDDGLITGSLVFVDHVAQLEELLRGAPETLQLDPALAG